MPGFGAKSVGADGRAKVTARTIEILSADGSNRPVAAEELLAPMPVASAISTLDEIFKPSAPESPLLAGNTIDYLRRQAESLNLPGTAVGLRLSWQPELFNIQSFNRVSSGAATVREVRW